MDSIKTAVTAVVEATSAALQATQSSTPASPPLPALSAKRDSDGLPVYFDRECDLELPRRLFVNWIPNDGPREVVRAPTTEERALLETRATALQDALRPFGEGGVEEVRVSVSALLGSYRAMRQQQGVDVESTVEITLAVLRVFPAWAITRACLKIARDGIERDGVRERRFAPNDTEISEAVEKIVRGYRDHMQQAFALLSAPVEQPLVRTTFKQDPNPPRPRPRRWSDSGHFERVAADLAARKARNAEVEG